MLDYVLYISAILTIPITQFSVLFFAISAQWCYGIILHAVKSLIKRCSWTDQLEYDLICKDLIRILFFAIGSAFSAGKLSPVATIMKRLSKKWNFEQLLHLQFLLLKSLVSAEIHSRSPPKLRTKLQKIELLYIAWFSFLFHELLKYYHQFFNNLDRKSSRFCYPSKMQVKECLQALIQKQRAMPVVSHIKAVYCPTKNCANFSERWKNSYMKTKKPHNRAVSVIYEHKKREIYVNFPWHDLCFVIECI